MVNFIRFIGRISPYYLAIGIPMFLILVINNLLFLKPLGNPKEDNKSFIVLEEIGREQLAQTLKENGIIRSSFAINLLLKREERRQNKEIILGPGEYELSPGLTPKEIAASVSKLERISRSFTIKAGDSYKDIISSIVKAGLFSTEEISQAMVQRQLLVKLRLSAGIPEGYFSPGTYSFFKPIKAEELVEKLIRDSELTRTDKFPNLNERAATLKLSFYDILILASLIEKENLTEEEKKNFSSLLHNRLLLGMPLESVPSLNYGVNILRGTNNAITEADRLGPNPYNTFIKPKLPATPIAAASIESIRAALYPNNTTFIYFRRNKDNTLNYFSNVKNFQANTPG